MNAEQDLYKALRPSHDAAIPPVTAAEYFVQVKLASGGLLPDEVTLLKEALSGQVDPAALQAAIEQAQMGGVTSGVRQSIAQDILHAAKMRRTGGERIGKELGTGAGALIGFLSGGASPAERAVRAGVGALVGKGAGKLVGQKIDTRRAMVPAPKQATIVKESAINPMAIARLRDALAAIDVDQLQDAATSSGASGGAEGALGDTATLAGVMAGSNAPGRMKIPAMVAGGLLGKGAASLATREKRAAAIERVRAMMKKAQLDSPTAVMENEPMQDAYPVQQQQVSSMRDTTGDALPAEPVLTPDQDLMPTPLDAILDMLQRGNEAEMYQQKAEDAEQVAQKAKAEADLAKGELEAVQKQQEIAVQQHAEELHTARTQAAASGAESQAVQQQLMEGQQQLQTAQSQTVSLMQAMNAFRQQMIDLLAMDPTQAAVPGAMAPSPGGGQIMQDPTQQAQAGMPGADPNAAAAGQPAAPQEGAPPSPEQGGEQAAPEGGESKPPKEEGDSEPKKDSAEPKKEPGDSKGVTVHVHGK